MLTSLDVNGNVVAINDLVQRTGFDPQMQYDANDRLAAAYSPAFGGDGWYRFGYDALDNLRTWTQPGEGQRRYDYDGSNRLTVIRNAGGAAIMGFAYDVQGNLSVKNGQGYQFDYGNRLRQATNLERYRYDGHGRRSSVIDAGSGHNRHYLYSQGGALAYLWDQGTGEYTQYIQLAGSLVATRKVDAGGAAVVRYQHTDALGSPVAETNEQAVVVQRTAYTPYGASIGAQKDGVGYTGHVMDGSTGLTYMQQRYMDPGVGVFLSVDPVTALSGVRGMFNRYRYAGNNPFKFIDPDGRCERATGSAICGSGGFAGSRLHGVTSIAPNGSAKAGDGQNDPGVRRSSQAWPTSNQTINKKDKPGEGGGEYGDCRGTRCARIHKGIDIQGEDGEAIFAFRDGEVVRADGGNVSGYGNQIVVKHADGLTSKYAHLESIAVNVG